MASDARDSLPARGAEGVCEGGKEMRGRWQHVGSRAHLGRRSFPFPFFAFVVFLNLNAALHTVQCVESDGGAPEGPGADAE